MKDNQIISQKSLVSVDSTNHLSTNSYIISKKFQVRHADLKRSIINTISLYDELKSHYAILQPEISPLCEALNIRDEIKEAILVSDRGRKINGWIITEKGYFLLLQQISTPKLPKTQLLVASARLEFAQAFMMLKDIHTRATNPNITPAQKEVLDAVINYAPYGTKSKVNGLPREKQVRGYFRSKNGKKLEGGILEEVTYIQKGLFGGEEKIALKPSRI